MGPGPNTKRRMTMNMNANGWRDCPECGNAFWQDNDDTTIRCCDYKLILTPMGKIAWVKKELIEQ
jgi:DNA-directed RNA polymerase subunit RPC12/RpoP